MAHLYVCDVNLKTLFEKLEHSPEFAIVWFEINYLKLDTDKCHLLISGNKNEHLREKFDQDIVWKSNDVELLGVNIENNLRFGKHISNFCL